MEKQTFLFTKEGYWTKYNQSQMREKILFMKLLKEICSTLPTKSRRDNVFCVCMKAYCKTSGRRIIGELELCRRAGFIERTPHFNSLFNYLNRNDMTKELQELIQLSSIPLRAVERKFCCDSTGFGASVLHDRWSQIRQEYSKHHKYLKAHIAFGTLTNIVTACRITEGNNADSPMLPELVEETSKTFKLEEWSADKGYLSRENYEAIWNKGATPLIPFKVNSHPRKRHSGIWQVMYHFFKTNNQLFMKKYHLRSNAESGFQMIKQRFGDITNMINPTGQQNDIMCKILCHNLCVLVQELFLLNIDFDFAQLAKEAAQIQG